MARTKEPEKVQDPNYGHGGSFVNDPDGTRRLVERTEDKVVRSTDDLETEETKKRPRAKKED